MADIFISYKSERRAAAQHLADILSAHGYSVWWDYGLVTGRDFANQIERELRAAKAVVVLWCSLSRDSQWVREEALLAQRLGTLLPALIERIEPPLGFGLAQTIDLTDWDGAPGGPALDRLLRDVSANVGRLPRIDHSRVKDLERQWTKFGAPPLAGFALKAPLEDTRERQSLHFDEVELSPKKWPMPAMELRARFRERGVPRMGLRLISRARGLLPALGARPTFRALAPEPRPYVMVADYEEQKGRELSSILSNLMVGSAFDRTNAMVRRDWYAIKFPVSEVLYKQMDWMPATWKGLYRILTDPARLGLVAPSAWAAGEFDNVPRDYWDDSETWAREFDEAMKAASRSAVDLFGFYRGCYRGISSREEKGAHQGRIFVMKNLKLRDLAADIVPLGTMRAPKMLM